MPRDTVYICTANSRERKTFCETLQHSISLKHQVNISHIEVQKTPVVGSCVEFCLLGRDFCFLINPHKKPKLFSSELHLEHAFCEGCLATLMLVLSLSF